VTLSDLTSLDFGLDRSSTPVELERRVPRIGSLRPPASPARVLVVIPTLNEAPRIAEVIRSLVANPLREAELRIVVVDGGSTDGTVSLVEGLRAQYPELELLDNPRRLQGAGINLAARAFGDGVDVLVRCDAHAAYPPNFCQRLLDSMATHGADAVVVPLVSRGESALQRAVAWVSNTRIGTGGAAHRQGGTQSAFVDHGHHAAFRMQGFRAVGGYDESFSHNEDAELDCRQRALGARIFLDADNAVGYYPRASWRALARQYFKYGEGRSRTSRRHPTSLRARQLAVPANLLLVSFAVALSPMHPAWLLWPAFYAAALAATSLYCGVRHRSLSGLFAGPAAGVMHVAWGSGFVYGLLRRRQPTWERESTVPLWPAPETDDVPRLRALLVDPSLFTAPYDGALNGGLLAAGVRPSWAVRPVRPKDRQEIPAAYADEIFYRKSDRRDLPGKLRKIAKGFSHVLGLVELVRRTFATKPDVVHFQWLVVPLLDALAILVLRRRVPVVVTVHDTVAFNGDKPSRLQALGSDWPLRLADRLIVLTRSGRERLVARGFDPARVAVIPHGPMPLRTGLRAVRARRDPRFTFVMFGEIKPYKGLDVLVEALQLVPEEVRAQARIVVAGRPMMDLAPIEARIAELGLGSTLELRPHRLSDAEMAELFDEADSFVFPYRQVDASGVYYQAKSTSAWLIASRVGIFAEDLEDGVQGTLLPPGDASALAAAMVLAVTFRYRSLGGARDTSWDSIGALTRDTYAEAIRDAERRA